MISLHQSKQPRLTLAWVLVFVLLAGTLLPASAAAPRIEASSTGSDGSVYGWQDTYVADIASRTGHSAVWTGTEMIIWGGYTSSGALNTGGRYNPATGVWKTISTKGAPEARANQTAVWTGTEMIVWGGDNDSTDFNTGGRYNPATDTWTSIATAQAPVARHDHTAVWTGKEMIIWGGYVYDEIATYFNDGGRYDPATNTWATVSTVSAPEGRYYHTAVWTGTQMIIWGGRGKVVDGTLPYFNTGGLYSPADNRWAPVSLDSAPSERAKHSAVFWTNGDDRSEMIIWGGCGENPACLNTGGHYDIKNNSWTATTMLGAPDAREEHAAVVAGTKMLIWGGQDDTYLNTGGRYNLVDQIWEPLSADHAPSPRYHYTAVWSGTELIIWGGISRSEGYIPLSSGGRYNPTSDTWTVIELPNNAPAGRMDHTAVWTGSEMIIWGGSISVPAIGNGGRYNPTTNTWAPTDISSAPEGRTRHTAVWTGTRMIIWGGTNSHYAEVNTGGSYDPAANTWAAIATNGAPTARSEHTAVWTGGAAASGKMIVWGGMGGGTTVGLYDPQSNTWELVAADGAPDWRYGHTAVWTGTKMLVWGGRDSSGVLNTGGRFDPTAKTWQPISTDNAPEARYAHTAIWTGTKMIVWGGQDRNGTWFKTGGSYDPETNQWETITLTNAPTARGYHTAVWASAGAASTPLCYGADVSPTGADASVASAVMVIWGGTDGKTSLNTGGCYNPTTHTWAATSTVNVPAARSGHTAVWASSPTASAQMIIWGGSGGGRSLNTGGRYKVLYPVFMPMISLNRN